MTGVRRARVLLIALILSLAVNGFFLGHIVAHVLGGPMGPPPPETMLPRLVDDLASRLAAADAAILRQGFAAHEAEIAERSKAVGLAHDHVRDALGAAAFDATSLAAALDEVRDREQALHAAVQQAMLETVPKLSAEARRRLAAWTPLGH